MDTHNKIAFGKARSIYRDNRITRKCGYTKNKSEHYDDIELLLVLQSSCFFAT